MSASCCHVVGDALGIHVPSTSHVGCCVGTLCQLACPSRRPSPSPPRSRWVVVGRSRTARRSHVLRCGAGCLMTRLRATPGCPAVSDECVETAATPAAHEYVSFALLFVPSFATRTRPFREPLWGARGARSLSGTGWRVGQRRAGRCGGWVSARAAAPTFSIRVRSRSCPCCHAWTSRFYRLQPPRGFFALTPTSGSQTSKLRVSQKIAARSSNLSPPSKTVAEQQL